MSDDGLKVVTGQFGSAEKDRAALLQSLRTVRETWPQQLELFELVAQIARAKYLAYIREGFTEAQALELCK